LNPWLEHRCGVCTPENHTPPVSYISNLEGSVYFPPLRAHQRVLQVGAIGLLRPATRCPRVSAADHKSSSAANILPLTEYTFHAVAATCMIHDAILPFPSLVCFACSAIVGCRENQLCKTMLMENTAWQPHADGCPDNDPANSRFYLVIVQCVKRLSPAPCVLSPFLKTKHSKQLCACAPSALCRPPSLCPGC